MTRAPAWARVLLWTLAPTDDADAVLGDFEELHRRRRARHGAVAAQLLTTWDTFDLCAALISGRFDRLLRKQGAFVQDFKLGLRMLRKYPGLAIAGGLALAIAIGIGSAWFDLSRDLLRPSIPLDGGDRIVEVEMRDSVLIQDERRLLHDFVAWRRTARSVVDLSAYRTVERNLTLGTETGPRPDPITTAEITASGFRVARVSPLMGRPLLDADEIPGAQPVVVLGYSVWQREFGARPDVVGTVVQLGQVPTMVVGVMPDGFAFPIYHRLWIPLQLRADYPALEGPGIRIFGRLAPGATQAQANAELTTLAEHEAAASPNTHEHLRPRVLAYGGESPGDRSLIESLLTHVPILLVLIVACANVGTLIYARTATRNAEIATRYALGASRGRIVFQLFVEALVLASIAAVVGLFVANSALKWGVTAYYSGQIGRLPFWIQPGLKPVTVVFAAGITVLGAAILGVLPALKATGAQVQGQLKNLGAGGSTLRFGWVWTTVMVAQVALTVICIPPATGITHEALRDHQIRKRFPTTEYLATRIDLDQPTGSGSESAAAFNARLDRAYRELEQRLLREPGVRAVTFGDRLPGMGPAVRAAEFEPSRGASLIVIANLWTASVGTGYFDAFDVPLVVGRAFHDGDRDPASRSVIVNEAFARRYLDGASPVGHRVRFAARTQPSSGSPASRGSDNWFEIVGMVRDVGMTPTDLGEAPYLYRASTPATSYPLVVGVRAAGDPARLAPRLREVALSIDPGLRLVEVRTLDDFAWRIDLPAMVAAGALVFVVSLGLFLSAAGIFSLMSVSIARRTREIGLRAALGATPARLLRGIFSRAMALVGSGILAGNAVLLLVVAMSEEVTLDAIVPALIGTSTLMLMVGLVACAEPARRALRIAPTDALRQS